MYFLSFHWNYKLYKINTHLLFIYMIWFKSLTNEVISVYVLLSDCTVILPPQIKIIQSSSLNGQYKIHFLNFLLN